MKHLKEQNSATDQSKPTSLLNGTKAKADKEKDPQRLQLQIEHSLKKMLFSIDFHVPSIIEHFSPSQ